MSGSDRRDEGEEAFVRQLKSMLDEGNARLDARVRSRLTQARHAALAQADSRPKLWLRQWAPAAGVAAAVVLAVFVTQNTRHEPPPDVTASDLEFFELAGENLDLLEDLDFYEWVDADTQQNSI